jgi:hypothetical protein
MPLDSICWPTSTTTVDDEATALLIRARGLLERGWCRGATARNLLRLPVRPYSRWATAWCASGALRAARGTASGFTAHRANVRLIAAIGGETLWDFNDGQKTVEPVLAAFDRAIAEGHSPSAGASS